MRLYDLRLAPFGVFDDLSLPFQPGRVHVVFGPNEAGKSTCHAALVGHFFGWGKARKDSVHVAHVRGSLARVAARWKPREGADDVEATRLGQKVVDGQGHDLGEGAYEARFAPFGKSDFETFFALDHGTLRDGGSLLGDKSGGLRDALFAAARSGDDINRIRAALTTESDELFKPRAKVLPVNRAYLKMKADGERARDLSSPPEKWDVEARAVQAATRLREALAAQQAELLVERDRLGSIRKLLDCVPTLRELETALGQLPAAEVTTADPGGVRERILRLDTSVQDASTRAAAATTQLEVLTAQLGAARADAAFAAHVEAAREARSAALDLARLEATTGAAPELGPEPASEAQLEPLEAALQALARATERQAALAGQRAEHEAELARTVPAPAPAPSAAQLRVLERHARDHESAAAKLAELRAVQARAEAELDARAGFAEAATRLTELALPTRDEARELVATLKELEADAQRVERELGLAKEQAERLAHELELLHKRAPMPHEDELQRTREERDRLAARALAGEPAPELLAAVREADAMVDAMRRGADRIAERAAKEDEHARTVHRQEQLRAEVGTRRGRAEAERASLEARLAGLPGPARTALELESWAALREGAHKLAAEAREIARLEAARADSPATEPAAELAARVDDAERAERGLAVAAARHEELRGLAARTAAEHEAAIRDLALAEQALVMRAREVSVTDPATLESWIRAARNERSSWERARAQGDAHQTAQGDIGARRALLRDRLPRLGFASSADDALGQSPEALAAAIDERVHTAVAAEERARLLERDVLAAETSLAIAKAEGDAARNELTAALDRLALGDVAHADRALRSLGERHELEARLGAERAVAARIAAPADPAPLLAEAAGYEAAELDRRIGETRAKLAELDGALDQARRDEAARKAGLESMSRADHSASEALVEAEAARAEAVALASQWAVAKLGVTLLHRALDRYREEHQDPVLVRASEAFRALTQGRYRRIVPELGDGKEKLRLAVERHDGQVQVASVLSEGTRDQLYLAMRFGTLASRAEDGQLPLPIVLDDVFVNFDDERTEAGLAQLAALVPLTDVIYFTHHARVVELAERSLPKHLLDVVRLPAPERSG